MKECKNKKSFAVREKKMLDSGITLIALVITIIILLILAGITINLALAPDGIVKRAQTAGDEYKDAQDKELSGLGKLENMLNEISDKIAENNGSTSGGGKDLSNVDKSVIALKAGDYIKYNTGDAEVGETTFRVLYPVTSEYGLQIVANSNIGDKITLGGENLDAAIESYKKAKQTLNTASEKYLNETYASDARSLGSFPNIGINGKFTKKNDGFVDIMVNTEDDSFSSDVGVLTSDAFKDSWKIGYYNFADRPSEDDDYWMASTGIDYDTPVYEKYGNYVLSGCCCPDESSCEYGMLVYFWPAMGDEYLNYAAKSHGLRPVIALKYNEIKITEGNGSEEAPYEIGLK